MATLKVKLRKSTIPEKPGSIYYQITHRRKSVQINPRIRLHPDRWNALAEEVVPAETSPAPEQQQIDNDRKLLSRIIRELESESLPYTAADIAARFRSREHRTTVLRFMRELIQELRSRNRLGTARNYERAHNSLAAYLRGADLPLSDLTESVIEGYNAHLQGRGVVRNTVSFYMRILRSVYNQAVRKGLIAPPHPFGKVYTGIDRTRKRALEEKVIHRLDSLPLAPESSLGFVRDLFLFSYCTRGMAFVDIAYLRKEDLRRGTIRYTRHKTTRPMCVRIEPYAQQIIDRHPAAGASPYLFPILTSEEPAEAYLQYQTALNHYNRRLKRLSEMLQLDQGLTSYVARHSWATAARDRNIPLSVISAGMGHDSERTTRIYLTMLDDSLIDSCNSAIVAALERTPPAPSAADRAGAGPSLPPGTHVRKTHRTALERNIRLRCSFSYENH